MTQPDDVIVDAMAADDEPPQRRIRLGTTDEIAAEIARVYRDARGGKLKTQEASRLVFMLYTLAKVKEADLEARLLQMENLIALGRTGR